MTDPGVTSVAEGKAQNTSQGLPSTCPFLLAKCKQSLPMNISCSYMLTLVLISFQSLETEMKKLQNSIQESTQNFDKHLKRLFERRVKAEMVVNQVNKSLTYMTFF